ncbi:TIGR02680 family protein [Streptomyces violaceorubidus]
MPTVTVELTAPDGDFHLVRHSAVLAVDAETCAAALQAWDERLDAAQPVIRNRSRFVTELGTLIERSNEARREATEADAARERLEEQAEHARSRTEQRLQETVHESEAYARAATAWSERLRESTGAPLDALLALVAPEPADGPLPAQTPEAVVEAARSAVDPWLAALGAERDDLSLTVRERETEQDRLRQQREDWERHTDPEPPPPPHRTAPRTPGTGAPLYRLVDFAHDVGPDARAGLEAALEASGLLDAWVRADGTVLDPATRDTLLVPGAPVPGATLAQVLRPVAAPDSGVTAEQVERVLGAVALAAGETLTGEPGSVGVDLHVGADVDVERAELHTAIGTDGSWRSASSAAATPRRPPSTWAPRCVPRPAAGRLRNSTVDCSTWRRNWWSAGADCGSSPSTATWSRTPCAARPRHVG